MVKFANEPVLDKIFERIRTEVNKIDGNDGIFDGNDGIFVAFTKIKMLTNEKLHLKLSQYFEDAVVHFRRVIRKSRTVYYIEANLDKAKI